MKLTIIGTHLGARIRKDGLPQFEGLRGVDAVFGIDFLDAAISELTRLRKSIHWNGEAGPYTPTSPPCLVPQPNPEAR